MKALAARSTTLQLVGLAAAAGIVWGFVMAYVAWRREGAEIVLLQGWILAAAWVLGRGAREPVAGALAGLAVVAGAVWTYELLPGWGLEAFLTAEGADPAEVRSIALAVDRDDIVLFSTLVVGALIGLGGAMRPAEATPSPQPDASAPPAAADPVPEPEPPPALWARFEHPERPQPAFLPPVAPVQTPAPAPVRESSPAHATLPWSAAVLMAALATDFALDRAFEMYLDAQGRVAVAMLVVGVLGAGWYARRYALFMAIAGAVLALGFGAVQHAEYGARADPETGIVR